MSVSIGLVKELRKRTQVSYQDCRKALQESNGDIEEAILILRRTGMAAAVEKANRVTTEGLVAFKINNDGRKGVLVEINCQTDFVARNTELLSFADVVAHQALQMDGDSIEQILQANCVLEDAVNLEEKRRLLVAKMGENIQLRRVKTLETNHPTAVIAGYCHAHRIAVLVSIDNADAAMANDLAMHIVACHPIVVAMDDISSEILSVERETYRAQLEETATDEQVERKVSQFLKASSLLEQRYFHDNSVTVAQYLSQKKAKVLEFKRFEMGEGIDKPTRDSSSETAKLRGEE